ncbi:hypothetical protein AMTR_s00126p00080460 [Amborella trichopoda]|uniref:DYW domain-containing protein n=1 Tax=Amborella trichopoda TaxID=13333 RepID=W1NML8_AMBTC|nr:hypothetical protein AMTR_s00126p00080460 [Amborella trichopoda]
MRKRSTFRVFTASEKTKPTSNPPKPDYPLNQTSLSARPTLAHLTHLLQKCSNCRALQQGKQIHQLTIVHGFCDSYLCTKLVHVYVRCSEIVPALQLFDQMPQRNVFAWTSIIEFYSQNFMYRECLQLYYQMIEEGVEPDGYVFPKLDIGLLERHIGALGSGQEIHAYGLKRIDAFKFYDSAGGALMTIYGMYGMVEDAWHVFEFMDKGDVVSWNAMIMGLVHCGQAGSALRLFADMQLQRVQHDHVTIATVLPACSSLSALKLGKQIHTHVLKSPNVDSATIVWNALIDMVHQNVHFGRIAAERLFVLEPENPGNYITLSNIYVRVGRWDDAASVRRRMESRALMKPSGCSWIEAEGH